MPLDLAQYLTEEKTYVDAVLDEVLPSADTKPVPLYEVMRYSVFAGGKRIRPILAIAAACAVGGSRNDVRYLCAALECIHTYSLIHDDLPAMDNDDMRRGKPTAHKQYGEALAILAGDALLTFAFELMTSPAAMRTARPDKLLAAIADLATAAGGRRLIAGQVMDILNEGKETTAEVAEKIVQCKTAALIRSSLTCGARLAGAEASSIEALGDYGAYVGAAFQIRDDLLDLEGDAAQLGKAVHKDRDRGKVTYPKLYGRDKSLVIMGSLLSAAKEKILPFGAAAESLALIADYIGKRFN